MNQEEIIKAVEEVRGQIELPARGISMGRRWSETTSLIIESRGHRVAAWSDVVVYHSGKELVAHRVVRIMSNGEKRRWITKGDGFCAPDRWPVPEEKIVGVVTHIRADDQVVPVNRGWRRCSGVIHATIGLIGTFIWPPLKSAD